MSADLRTAPHGLNLVIETRSGRVILGRFDSTNGFEVVMHDVDVLDPAPGSDPEHYIRETATYGVDVKHRDYAFEASSVVRWRRLGEIEKLA